MRILPRIVAVACFTLAVLNLPGEIATAAITRSMTAELTVLEIRGQIGVSDGADRCRLILEKGQRFQVAIYESVRRDFSAAV